MQSSKALCVIHSKRKLFIVLKLKEATKPIYCTNGVDLRLWLTVDVPKSSIFTCFSTFMCGIKLKCQYISCNSSCLCIYQTRRINIQILLIPNKILRGGRWNKRKGATCLFLLFPLACSWSWGIFLQPVSPTALELLILSIKYIIYPMRCWDSFKVPGLLRNISKHILRVLGLRTSSQLPPHFLVTLNLQSLVTCWLLLPESALPGAVCQVWVCHAICSAVPGICCVAEAALVGWRMVRKIHVESSTSEIHT